MSFLMALFQMSITSFNFFDIGHLHFGSSVNNLLAVASLSEKSHLQFCG